MFLFLLLKFVQDTKLIQIKEFIEKPGGK